MSARADRRAQPVAPRPPWSNVHATFGPGIRCQPWGGRYLEKVLRLQRGWPKIDRLTKATMATRKYSNPVLSSIWSCRKTKIHVTKKSHTRLVPVFHFTEPSDRRSSTAPTTNTPVFSHQDLCKNAFHYVWRCGACSEAGAGPPHVRHHWGEREVHHRLQREPNCRGMRTPGTTATPAAAAAEVQCLRAKHDRHPSSKPPSVAGVNLIVLPA